MDADQRLTDDALDGRLRALFQAAGPLHAADDLEARVLARLSAAPVRTSVVAQPLMSRNAWVGAVIALLALWSLSTVTSSPDMASTVLPELPALRWDPLLPVLTTPWTLMALSTGALLLLLDAVLSRPRPAPRTA